jgi:hypothetical protein
MRSHPDSALLELVRAVVADDSASVVRLLAAAPQLAAASFGTGATRQAAHEFFLGAVGKYIYAGDTALHFAAAGYRAAMVQKLVAAGAHARARNRRGDEPLHAAASGQPGSLNWNPAAQAATIVSLVDAGADPNATNMNSASPLHKAVRTRCAKAVRTLLECGADPWRKNKSGSTPMLLVRQNTGRGGSGSAQAKAQQLEIQQILEAALKADSNIS